MLMDRGTKKWTALMLPEHTVEIKKWKQEQFHDKKRELTEWEFDEIEQVIQRAHKQQVTIKLTLWEDNRVYDVIGIITGMVVYKKEMLLETSTAIKRIHFGKMQKATLVDADD